MRPLARETAATSPTSAFPSALRAGALAAVGTWTVVVLPALIGWVAAPESTVGWFSAVSLASAIWFLGHGQSIGAGGVAISVTPLLLMAVFVYIAYRWARRLSQAERLRAGADHWSRVAKWGVVPGFLVGYGVSAAVFALFTLGGPATPGVAAVLGALLVPLAALGIVMVRPDDDTAPAFVRTWFRRGPTWLPSVWRIGWQGGALLLGLGLALALLRVAVAWPEVADVQSQYAMNVGALCVIVLAQAALLGNAATWALSFLAGPGFQVALGSTVSPGAAQPGLLPLVPLLGALPEAADYPTATYAVLLLPVALGVWLGSRVDAALEFFGNVRARLTAAATAAFLAVLVVAGLTALGNGAVGVARLAAVGPHLSAFTGALLAEVAAGALLWVGVQLLRERLASRRRGDGTEEVDGSAGSDAAAGATSSPDGAARDDADASTSV